LIKLEHPTQDERYEYGARGLRSARMVTIKHDGKAHQAVTRYVYDSRGVLLASALPDGSSLSYERNGQGQVVALKRSAVQTSWLKRLAKERVIATDMQRDLVGVKSITYGNGVKSQRVRSRETELARIVHTAPDKLQTALDPNRPWREQVGEVGVRAIESLLGVGVVQAQPSASIGAAGGATANALPGALGLPQDKQALIDHRYLWDAAGRGASSGCTSTWPIYRWR
jgi:YD repeat-containing protein